MVLIHQVNLTDEDRSKLHDLLKVGEHSAGSIARGDILLRASQGKSDDEIAQTLEVGRATVQRVRKRYCQKGLEHAFTELPRPGAKPRLDGKQEAYLVALYAITRQLVKYGRNRTFCPRQPMPQAPYRRYRTITERNHSLGTDPQRSTSDNSVALHSF